MEKKDIKMDGFRKGSVTYDLYVKKIGVETLFQDAADLAIDKKYSEALKEVEKKYPEAKKIMPVSVYQAEGQKTRNLTFRVVLKKDK